MEEAAVVECRAALCKVFVLCFSLTFCFAFTDKTRRSTSGSCGGFAAVHAQNIIATATRAYASVCVLCAMLAKVNSMRLTRAMRVWLYSCSHTLDN